MSLKFKNFEFFPKRDAHEIRLDEAYAYLLIFGTFGAHQFYLKNKKKALYFLATSGVSHGLVLIALTFKIQINAYISVKWQLGILLVGYVLALPLLIWDMLTLPFQVKNLKGNLSSF